MKKIALITAMESELNEIKSLYDFYAVENGWRADLPDRTLFLMLCGMGKVNAAMTTERACRVGAELVISLGVAGGIDSSLKQGDTVVSTRVCYHDVWCGEPNQKGQVQGLPLYYETPFGEKTETSDPTVKKGLIVTGDQFVTDEKHLLEIKSTFPEALAVDMESASIAQVCYLNKVPFLSVRVISDVVGGPNQDDMYKNFWDTCPRLLAGKADDILKKVSF